MKKTILILSFFCLPALSGFAQQPCNTFDCAYQKAEQILKTSTAKDKYEKVLANLDDAENFAGSDKVKRDQIKAFRQKAFLAIRKEKERADAQAELAKAEKERANKLAEEAKSQTKIAIQEKLSADSSAAANRRQTLTAYANDLAYKSQIALEQGDRTTAFQLAFLAHSYVEEGNTNVTRALVEALYFTDVPIHQPLPWSANLEGHTDAVWSVAISPDGKRIATGSHDNTAKVWDLASGKPILNFKGHSSPVNSIAFSLDGQRLATGSDDHTAKVWDLQSGKLSHSLQGHTESVESVAFSPNGQSLATGSDDKTAKIWEISPEQIIQKANKNRHLAPINGPQLISYNLETLLDLHPDNESKLIATHEVWQIKAFADLAAAQAGGSNVLSRVEAPYARANRLYAAALALQDELLIKMDWAKMLRKWAAVYRDDGKEAKAKELEGKADGLWKEE